MFGNLFEDESDAFTQNDSARILSKNKDGPGKPRSGVENGGTGLAGIANQGATCYLNSLIQTLLFTPELRDAVFSLPRCELGEPGSVHYRAIPTELQMLFAEMLLLDQDSVSTTKLTDSFGWNDQEELCQHDVQELNRILFSALEDSLVGLTCSSIIRDLYRGVIVNQIRCKECGVVSEREEQYLDLTVPVAGYSNLSDSLTDLYLNTELLAGSNQYRCDCCSKLVDAEKGAKLRELPAILTICLQRLTFDPQTMRRQKGTSKFAFPREISMGAYLDSVSDRCTDYELFSVVAHRGGAHGGHYHAMVRDIDQLAHWTQPEGRSETSKNMSSRKQDEGYLKFNTPYELIGHILKQEADWITTDQLSLRIQQETGVSWSKRFKKKYNNLSRFLINNPEVCEFDESMRRVRNRQIASVPTDDIPSEDRLSNDIEEMERSECWFSLDDRKVKPAHTSDIEKYYGGKESAYMLYYRQKSMNRPTEARGNVRYLVPQHVIEKVEQTNRELRSKREEEDLRLNTVNIRVYPPTRYTFSDNFITFKTEHTFLDVVFDQRKTVEDLTNYLLQTLPSDEIVGDDSHLYLVKCVHNSLHVLNDLSDGTQEKTTLVSLGLSSSKGFLLLPKSLIESHSVLCGAENEPFQISVDVGGNSRLFLLPQSLSVQELPTLVMKEFKLEPPIYVYHRVNSKKPIELSTHENVALRQRVKDGAVLVVSQDEYLRDGKIKLTFKGEIDGLYLERSVLSVESTDSVASLSAKVRQLLTDKLNLDQNIPFRLRRTHEDAPGLPLFLDRTLAESNLHNGDSVLIEKGDPVTSSMMVLYYSSVFDGVRSITCKCTQSVQQCIEQMVQESGAEGAHHYIMTLDWAGEPSNYIYNTDQSLAKARIKHGDCVALFQGTPPPKNAVTVTVKWAKSGAESPLSYKQWLIDSMDSLAIDDTVKQSIAEYSSWSTVVDRSITIETLKCDLLRAMGDAVTSANHVRLRSFDNNRPGVIYKSAHKTLQQYKLRGDNVDMYAELLQEAEALSEEQLVLTLRKKNMANGDYEKDEPFVWEMTKTSTAAHLRRQLASHLQCPTHDLHIAKFEAKLFDWRLISDRSSAAKGKGKVTSKAVETNLRKAPYQIEDGDLIGYIITTNEWQEINAKSFYTRDQENLIQMSLEKKRQERKVKAVREDFLISDDGKTDKRTEKAISIKVANFTKTD